MVFLSYSREDRPAATALMHALAEEHIDCIADPELLEGDPFWRQSVAAGFADCELMVGLISEHAIASPWVEQEQRAFERRKMWVLAGSGFRMDAAAEGGAESPVPLDRAVAAICDALSHQRRSSRRHSTTSQASLASDRIARTQKAEAALVAFRAALPRLPRPRVDFEDSIARVGGGFLQLQRVLNDVAPAVWMGVLPVTNAQYRAFLEVTDYPEPPTWTRSAFRLDEAPVTGVNWYEACAFALWVGGALPSETEWMQAARGASATRIYATATGDVGEGMACFGQPFGAAAPLSAKACRPNPEGFYGMCGNTWDWCASTWGTHRVIRGGGVMDASRFCAIRSRYRNAPIDRDCCVGFRVKIDARARNQ
jgi:Sulfatase-modifying factor enzyme 1/TIR domain